MFKRLAIAHLVFNLLSLGIYANHFDESSGRPIPQVRLGNVWVPIVGESFGLGHREIYNLNGIEKLEDAQTINLIRNHFEDIGPLAHLQHLRILHLSQNKVSNLTPLAKLTKLIELDIIDTEVKTLHDLPDSLQVLYIDESISNEEVIAYEKRNPNCYIFQKKGKIENVRPEYIRGFTPYSFEFQGGECIYNIVKKLKDEIGRESIKLTYDCEFKKFKIGMTSYFSLIKDKFESRKFFDQSKENIIYPLKNCFIKFALQYYFDDPDKIKVMNNMFKKFIDIVKDNNFCDKLY
jgi:hypothetical protein